MLEHLEVFLYFLHHELEISSGIENQVLQWYIWWQTKKILSMSNENIVIQEADFNPRIRKYILHVVAFYLFLSVAGIPLILIWYMGVGQAISKRYYEHLHCRLTESHLEFKKGVLFRVEKTIPLENIQDLTFIDNPFLRWFDLRIQKIETAGSSNPQGSDMKLIGITDTPTYKEKVLEQRKVIRNKAMNMMGGGSGSSGDESVELLKEIRDLLKDIKDKQDFCRIFTFF